MLESEAETKWCPHVRVMNTKGEGGGNRWDSSGQPAESPNGSLCLGSGCMMWEPWLTSQIVNRDDFESWGLEKSGWRIDPNQDNLPLAPNNRITLVRIVHEPWGDCGLKAKECNCHD